jgi:hypothetical protein
MTNIPARKAGRLKNRNIRLILTKFQNFLCNISKNTMNGCFGGASFGTPGPGLVKSKKPKIPAIC